MIIDASTTYYRCKACGAEGYRKDLLFHDCVGGIRKSYYDDDTFQATVEEIEDPAKVVAKDIEDANVAAAAKAEAAEERKEARREAKEEKAADERADLREAIKAQGKKGRR